MHKHYRITVLIVALAMLVTAALPAFAEPLVPGAVTVVDILDPTDASEVCVKAGDTFGATFTTDGGNQIDLPLNEGQARFWLGGTISLGTVAIHLPVDPPGKTVMLTVPAGTADNRYDFAVEAKSNGQQDWVADKELDAVVVDSTAPAVPAGTILTPQAGETLKRGDAYDITWNEAAIANNEKNVSYVTLQLWVDGALRQTIAAKTANDGIESWIPDVTATNATIRLIVNDCAGQTAADMSGAFTIWAPDNTVPNVSVTTPAPNVDTWIGASYGVQASADDPESGITKVEFFYSADAGATWTLLGSDSTGPGPYSATWNVAASGLVDGTQVWIKAKATNGAGAWAESAVSPVSPAWAKIDKTAPAVTLTAPVDGSWVSAAAGFFTLQATASDATSKVKEVQFWFSKDGTNFDQICVDTTEPYSCDWVPADFDYSRPEGWPATFKAVAVDNAGNKASDTNSTTVESTLPQGTPKVVAPNGGEAIQIGSTFSIKWTKGLITDLNLLPNPVSLYLTADGAMTWDLLASGLADSGSWAWKASGVPGTNYWVKIVYADKAGNAVMDMSDAAFTLFGNDSTPPTVAITAPAANGWFDDVITVEATAGDPESSIMQVLFQYKMPGGVWTDVAAADMHAPWQAAFDPMNFTGSVQFRAIAQNGVGLQTTSAVVTFNFDFSAPTVGFEQPGPGATVSGNPYDVIAAPDDGDGSGVKSVTFYLGEKGKACNDPTMKWTTLGTATAVPWKVSWNSASVADGDYCFKAVATDNMGNKGEVAEVHSIDNVYSIGLQGGWNLISTPVLPYNADIANIMSSLVAHGSIKQVATFVWSGGKLVQQTWLPGAGGTLKTFVDGQGYWVEMLKADTLSVTGRVLSAPPSVLPQYAVSAGWNIIGFTARDKWSGENYWEYLGASVYDKTEQLYGWDATNDYYVSVPSTSSMMYPGEGYWLATGAAGTIYP